MGFSVKGLISGFTGGLVGSGKSPGQDPSSQGNQLAQWSPEDAENDFVNNAMSLRNGGMGQQATKLIGQYLKNNISGPALSDSDPTESFD